LFKKVSCKFGTNKVNPQSERDSIASTIWSMP